MTIDWSWCDATICLLIPRWYLDNRRPVRKLSTRWQPLPCWSSNVFVGCRSESENGRAELWLLWTIDHRSVFHNLHRILQTSLRSVTYTMDTVDRRPLPNRAWLVSFRALPTYQEELKYLESKSTSRNSMMDSVLSAKNRNDEMI